jgi:hypothetical protein
MFCIRDRRMQKILIMAVEIQNILHPKCVSCVLSGETETVLPIEWRMRTTIGGRQRSQWDPKDFDQERRNAKDLGRKAIDFDRACQNAKYFVFNLCACADSNPEIPDHPCFTTHINRSASTSLTQLRQQLGEGGQYANRQQCANFYYILRAKRNLSY